LAAIKTANKETKSSVLKIPETNQEGNLGASNSKQDSLQLYKALAIEYSNSQEADLAIDYLTKYIGVSQDFSILNDHLFNNIKYTDGYLNFKDKYDLKATPLSLVYIYAGFLGFFIFLVLILRRDADKIATILISLFVLFHSLFILHLSLYLVNLQYRVPHSLFVSTTFSFLYGPLLYFYFRRVIHNHKFKISDALHLIPSLGLLVYLLPYYFMSSEQKFTIIFDQTNFLLPGAYTIIAVKIVSLTAYAYLIIKLYTKNLALQKAERITNKAENKLVWQRNIIGIFVAYTLSYFIYAAIITKLINAPSLINLQIVVMVGLVFYVAYISYAQPDIFKGKVKLIDPSELFKYKNSGLTQSFSTELKDELLKLLQEEKVYKQNDLNLAKLSERLNTTRHNTSQVINEHFNMNFFELINTYRIQEAISILENDRNGNLNIIDVAYEVGFNNKVTFNKAFKKHLSQTPSQYLVSLRA